MAINCYGGTKTYNYVTGLPEGCNCPDGTIYSVVEDACKRPKTTGTSSTNPDSTPRSTKIEQATPIILGVLGALGAIFGKGYAPQQQGGGGYYPPTDDNTPPSIPTWVYIIGGVLTFLIIALLIAKKK